MRQLERPPLTQPYIPPVAPPARTVKRWFHGVSWGLVYSTLAIVSGSLGLAGAFLVPNPLDHQSSKLSPIESFSLRLTQGIIPYTLSRPVNIVIMGIDRVEGVSDNDPARFSGRSDTLLVVRLDPQQQQVNVLSIPRDTRIEMLNYGFTKINHSNWFGGPKLLQAVIAQNFNNLQIDRYVRVDTTIFREIVDALGGIEVNVPKAMHYTDQTQKLFINLEPGLQTLNGDQAEQFARFRHDEYGDIGRVQRQQILLKALRQELTNPATVGKIPKLLNLVESHVDTNLNPNELFAVIGFVLNLDSSNVNMVMLPGRGSNPGEFGASYWLMDPAAKDRILADQFNVPSANGNIEVHNELSNPHLQIAIQNASGQPHQARLMANYLVDHGFNNVYIVEDWLSVIPTTRIIAQRGDRESAKMIQDRLKLGQVEASSTGAIDSDITIRLGQDSISFLK